MRFVKFALVVGVSNTVDRPSWSSTCWCGGRVCRLLAASGLGWIAGLANSFVWNRAWTFADRGRLPSARLLWRFFVSNLAALAVDEAVIAALDRAQGHSLHGAGLESDRASGHRRGPSCELLHLVAVAFRGPVPS